MSIPQSAQDFGLFDALIGRRSRRVGLGATIPDGPLAYESPFEPVPLSDDERALLAFAALGVTGFNLGMPHTASGESDKGANYIVRYLGRTAPSGAGIESSEILITDDSGTYISQTRNLSPDKIAEIAESKTLDDYVTHAKNNLVKLSDDPVTLPAEWGFIDKHNWWTALQPGTTLIVPVLDSAEYGLNLLSLLSGEGTVVWDEASDRPVGKPEKLLKSGHLNGEMKVPYSFFESYLFKMANHELSLAPYNAQLALQAIGLGGWLYGGINPDALLGAFAEQGHRGFGFTYEQAGPQNIPNPVGLPEYFETLAPPFVSSPREAVETFIDRKFGPDGTYESAQGPYKDQHGIASQIQRVTDEQIEYYISVVEEIHERDGRYPGSGPTVLSGIYTQATHVDPEYYAAFHNEEALLETHHNHFHDWHGGEQPQRRK